jgi:hypothetical protein
MTDPNDFAFPPGYDGGMSLSIREYFACHIMGHLILSSQDVRCVVRDLPERAVEYADALIAALNAPTVDKPASQS